MRSLGTILTNRPQKPGGGKTRGAAGEERPLQAREETTPGPPGGGTASGVPAPPGVGLGQPERSNARWRLYVTPNSQTAHGTEEASALVPAECVEWDRVGHGGAFPRGWCVEPAPRGAAARGPAARPVGGAPSVGTCRRGQCPPVCTRFPAAARQPCVCITGAPAGTTRLRGRACGGHVCGDAPAGTPAPPACLHPSNLRGPQRSVPRANPPNLEPAPAPAAAAPGTGGGGPETACPV